MRTITSLIILIILPFIVQSQIPNNGFENWTGMGSYNNPDGWATLNTQTAIANIYTCTKGTPGSPGISYIKLTSKAVPSMGIKPGIAVSGSFNTATLQPLTGFPIPGRPGSFEGKWQYMASGSDQGYISILLTSWDSVLMKRDTISYTYKPLSGMAMSWANFTIPVQYQSTAFPDSALIVLSASNANGALTAANSYLYVDNLSFKNMVMTSITNPTAGRSLKVYPNPVKSQLFMELPNYIGSAEIIILDMNGKLVMKQSKLAVSEDTFIDVSTLPAGMFLLQVISGSYTATTHFIKE